MDIDKVAAAIEADAGQEIPGLEDSLREMQQGKVGRTYTPEQLLVVDVRKKLSLSQTDFADMIDTPVATLRDWEQGRFKPPGGVLCLLRLLGKRPEIVVDLAA
ncbi:MAG: XRE family transcriptional regulator [Proteobacteria bacterium]|nr:MAG: XRE family transcriptional regulator [Pseudomonadota bacterium]